MPIVSTYKASLADAAIVAGFVHALIDELSEGNGPGIEIITQSTQTVLEDARVFALIAQLDGDPVGIMILNECTAIYAGGRFGEISELYVRPDNRSQSVALKLIEVGRLEGRGRGWKRLEVGAPGQPKWKRTLDFYLRNGFEEVGPRLRCLL